MEIIKEENTESWDVTLTMDGKERIALVEYAIEHIIDDEKALVSWAVNNLLKRAVTYAEDNIEKFIDDDDGNETTSDMILTLPPTWGCMDCGEFDADEFTKKIESGDVKIFDFSALFDSFNRFYKGK